MAVHVVHHRESPENRHERKLARHMHSVGQAGLFNIPSGGSGDQISQGSRRIDMTHFDNSNMRTSVAAGIFAIVLSVSTLVAVAAPMAKLQNAVRTAQIVVPLA
jgi:hypothetical protein